MDDSVERLYLELVAQNVVRYGGLQRAAISDHFVSRILRYDLVAIGVHEVERVVRILPHGDPLHEWREHRMEALGEREKVAERTVHKKEIDGAEAAKV